MVRYAGQTFVEDDDHCYRYISKIQIDELLQHNYITLTPINHETFDYRISDELAATLLARELGQ